MSAETNTILLIDDEASVTAFVRAALERKGFLR
jgi:DNA-binding response OmpR family regulator